jgi:hypothetical protein
MALVVPFIRWIDPGQEIRCLLVFLSPFFWLSRALCWTPKRPTNGTANQPIKNSTNWTSSGEKALRFVIADDNLTLVIEKNVSLNYAISDRSRAALHDAAALRRKSILPRYLAGGADRMAKGENGETALAIRCRLGLGDSASLPLQWKSGLQTTDNALKTPLHYASGLPFGLVEDLVRAGSDPMAQDRRGNAPLPAFLQSKPTLRDIDTISQAVKSRCVNHFGLGA